MMSEAGSGSGSGLVEAEKPLSYLKDYVLPPKELFANLGIGLVGGNIYGFAHYQVHDLSGSPWGTRLRHGLYAGRQVGSRTAYWCTFIASVEECMATFRGKRDPLNTFAGATLLGGYLARISGRGPVLGSALAVGLGSYFALLNYITSPPALEPPATATRLETGDAMLN